MMHRLSSWLSSWLSGAGDILDLPADSGPASFLVPGVRSGMVVAILSILSHIVV